jgi:RHS repeat-associated protein
MADNEKVRAKNTLNKINMLNEQSAGTNSLSNAPNYKNPINENVNPQTGNLSLSIQPPKINSIFGDKITPSITYNQGNVQQFKNFLGLPFGWNFGLSYIDREHLFIDGSSSYLIDLNIQSGLKYYKLKNMELIYGPSVFPYNKSKEFSYKLVFHNGCNQYFDKHGKLLGMDDKYKNHVLFEYTNKDTDVFGCKLSKIINSFGQNILFEYKNDDIIIKYPNGGKNDIEFKYCLNSQHTSLLKYVDPVGNEISFTNKGGVVNNNLLSEVKHSNGLTVNYEYTGVKSSIVGSTNTVLMDFITNIKSQFDDHNHLVQYNYNPYKNEHNYTGYPKYKKTTNKDSLLESNDNDYRYHTQIDDGILITEHTYNYLHLELESKIFAKNDLSNPFRGTKNSYHGQKNNGFFPPYYNLPVNYQSISKIISTIYDDNGQNLIYIEEYECDDYGQNTESRNYKVSTESQAQLQKKMSVIYDHENYGIVLQQDSYDYVKDNTNTKNDTPSIRRELNTISADGKNIETSTIGFVEEDVFKPSKKTTNKYNSIGRKIYSKLAWVDKNNHALQSTEYSINYSIKNLVLAKETIDAKGNQSISEIDITTGWIIREVNALNQTVNYIYDNIGRQLSVTDSMDIETTMSYNDNTNKATVKHSNGYELYFYRNAIGLLKKKSDNLGPNGSECVLNSRSYNDNLQLETAQTILGVKSQIKYSYNEYGLPQAIEDPLSNITSYKYDLAGQFRETYFNNILQNTEKFNDQSLLLKSTVFAFDGDNKNTLDYVCNYNAYGKKLSEQLSSDNSLSRKNTYAYNSEFDLIESNAIGSDNFEFSNKSELDLFSNNVKSVLELKQDNKTLSDATSDSFVYNELNQLIEETNPLNQKKKYTYDAIGNCESVTAYDETVFTYKYSNWNELLAEKYVDKQGRNHRKEMIYGELDGLLSSTEVFVDEKSEGRIQYSYTIDGRTTSIIYPDGKKILIGYDELTRQRSYFIDALEQKTIYKFDEYGRLGSVQIENRQEQVEIGYYSMEDSPVQSGKIKALKFSNQIEQKYKYDNFGRLFNFSKIDKKLESGANVLLSSDYYYDNATQNILKVEKKSNAFPENLSLNQIQEYQYNSLSKLVGETVCDANGKQLSSKSYTYDVVSNITEEHLTDAEGKASSITYEYDLDNKLTSIKSASGNTNLKYDINGNLIDDGKGNLYTYNEKSKLVAFQNETNKINSVYEYYPNGLRKSKQVNSDNPILFYYDDSSNANIVNETQGTNTVSYLMLESKRYMRFVLLDGEMQVQSFLSDYKNDTAAITDQDGKVKQSYQYEPYGAQTELLINNSSIIHNPFQYNGEYFDVESGLIYLRARYYYPQIKRFISRDSAALINRYFYGGGNPINSIDPSGHMPKWLGDVLGGITIVLSAVAIVAGAMLIATGAGAPIGGALIASGVLGMASGATSIAAINTSGKLSRNLSYASLALGIGSAVAGGAAGAMGSAAAGGTVAATGAEITSNASVNAYRAMMVASALGAASGSVGIAAEAEDSKTLGYISIGLGAAAFLVGIGSAAKGITEGSDGGYFGSRSNRMEIYFRRIAQPGQPRAELENGFNGARWLGTTGESSVASERSYTNGYPGRLYKFSVREGTTDDLMVIGGRHPSTVQQTGEFSEMGPATRGWKTRGVQFKYEGGQMTINLGGQPGLNIFNNNLMSIEYMGFINVNMG